MSEHKSVLLKEAIEQLHIKENGIYVDATTGGGGHSLEILKRIPKGHLFCFDQDEFALAQANVKLSAVGNNYTFIRSNFVHLKEELEKRKITKIDGILYDLGVSSFQLDLPERGFSYQQDAKLDMRMNQQQSLSAYEVVNQYPYEDLVSILYRYGEEPFAKPIAKAICEKRRDHPIETTLELVEVIKSALPVKILQKKGHPAKQTFQAIRIAVNDELKVFEKSITDALDLLNPDGFAVVITFHSLEDRICKNIFKEKSTIQIPKGLPIVSKEESPFELITRHAIVPTSEELEFNHRSHSAKMRVLRKK